MFEAACHMPPAFSQSAFVVYFAKLSAPDGLAAGALDEPPEVPGVVVFPESDFPEGVLPELELPFEPLPLLPEAAATAGARAMIPTKSISISFCM